MKRFLCFGFPEFYPSGGLGDIEVQFDEFDQAMQWLGSIGYEHDTSYVFDRIEGIRYDQVPSK